MLKKMKSKYLMLLVLSGLLSTFTVSETYAQRGHYSGGGSGRVSAGGGGGRISAGGSGRIGGSSRIYVAPRQSAPLNRGGYYHGPVTTSRVYYGRPHYNYYYRPYFRPYYRPYFPSIGLYFSTLPFGYYSLGPAFGPVYYYGGTYYESTGDNRGYKVVEAPVGAAIPDLPDGAQEVTVDGNTYYELNGTFYQETMTDNGRRYVVVGKNGKIGDQVVPSDNNDNGQYDPNTLISELPENTKSVNINGQQYYMSPDGMYYEAIYNNDNSLAGYKVVGKMDDQQ